MGDMHQPGGIIPNDLDWPAMGRVPEGSNKNRKKIRKESRSKACCAFL